MQHMPKFSTGEIDPPTASSTIDLLELFWRRRYAVIAGTILGILLGVAYSVVATPKYESFADVLVVQKRPQAVTGDHQYESGFEDYLATHLAVMVSPLIVERAIKSHDLASLQCFADVEDPEEELVDVIIDDLEVEGGSRDLGESADSIMTVAYRCSVPEEAPLVVQALLDSYEAFHHEVYRGMSDSTVELIGEARDLLKNDLANQEDTYSQFRQQSPLVSNGQEEVNPLQDRLAAIETRISEVLLRRSEVESQLRSLQEAKESGADREELLARVTELRQQNKVDNTLPDVSNALETQLIQLIDGEQGLLEHYGPNHPHVLTMRQRIADTRRLFALPTTAHLPKPEPGQEAPVAAEATRDPVEVYGDYLQQELKSLKIAEDLLTSLYEKEHQAAKEHSIYQLRDAGYRRGIERTEELYDVVINRLQEASLVKDYGGFETTVIAPPRLGTKVSPRRRIILPAAAAVGMLLGCMLAFVAEFRDDSFQSCEQVQQLLGLPVVGQIPQFSAVSKSLAGKGRDALALDPMLCAFHAPRAVPAEAFRTLRTAVFFNGPSKLSRVIQVSGASTEDGASTIAANLAVSLAQTGKRVLLIDADLGEQKQQQMLGLPPSDTGLAAIIASDVEPADAVRQTSVDNLSLLTLGVLPEGPCELFTSSRFAEFINLMRDSYDHVLIDTDPLLTASDPFLVAPHTDGVLLVLRLGRDERRKAKLVKQMMDRMEVTILGIVVNRMSDAILSQRPVHRYRQAAGGSAAKGALSGSAFA